MAPSVQRTDADPNAYLDAIDHPVRQRDARESDALLERLGKHRTGVGCVYVNKLDDVDRRVLRRLVELAWAHPRG